ncbi:MAG: ParB/RepB/Spo0J family partition protein [Planctomycetota bacterium]
MAQRKKQRKVARQNPEAVQPIGVKSLRTSALKPNKHNPRRLFDKEDLRTLQDSIQRVGILVPLVVYREKSTGSYVILDGQRRWMCAQALDLKEVPVNEVPEPTLVQNIVTMFQIHKLREDWELMPTALKLELLMKELQERGEKQLASLTGLDVAVVTRCKKLLSYRKRYQDMMLRSKREDRVRADFFIELYPVRNDRFVNSLDWYNKDEFTDAMLAKHLDGEGLKSVTDFRKVKQHITNARKAGRSAERAISRRLREFTEETELAPDHLRISTAEAATSARNMAKTAEKLELQLRDVDVPTVVGETQFWKSLSALHKTISRLLKKADVRA